jgi:KR domain
MFEPHQDRADLRGTGKTGMAVVMLEADAGDKPIQALPVFSCERNAVYIITGGLGGFGLALAAWLVQQGASNLLLSSKRGIRTGVQARALAALSAQGVQVSLAYHALPLFLCLVPCPGLHMLDCINSLLENPGRLVLTCSLHGLCAKWFALS